MSLENSISNAELSSNGLSLRNSVISLLTVLMSDSEFVANSLSDYSVGEFVTKDNLRTEYNSISESLEYILNENVWGTISSKLTKISSIKDGIRNSINELYGRSIVPVSGELSYFEVYPDIIREISETLNIRTLSSIEITENGEYTPNDGEAFGSLSVSIPEKTLTTRAISENGTYYAQQDGADGYEWVQVSVTGNVPKFTEPDYDVSVNDNSKKSKKIQSRSVKSNIKINFFMPKKK